MTLMQRLSAIEGVGNRIEHQLGVPQRQRHIAFRERQVVGTGVEYSVTLINYAHVVQLPSKLVGLFFGNDDSSITFTKDDILVEFPRSEKWDGFINPSGSKTYDLLLDVTINESEEITAFKEQVKVMKVLEDDLLCWQLICRKKLD